jgi:hypothetical protein
VYLTHTTCRKIQCNYCCMKCALNALFLLIICLSELKSSLNNLLFPRIEWSGGILFLACLSVVCVCRKNLNLGHKFCNIEDSNLIFGMHVYLMELQLLSGEKSRSSFKVKGKIHYMISFVWIMCSAWKKNLPLLFCCMKITHKIHLKAQEINKSMLHPTPFNMTWW